MVLAVRSAGTAGFFGNPCPFAGIGVWRFNRSGFRL
jgi:hypothetical protein